jgi:hypothetical protein
MPCKNAVQQSASSWGVGQEVFAQIITAHKACICGNSRPSKRGATGRGPHGRKLSYNGGRVSPISSASEPLLEYPAGLSPVQTRQLLGIPKDLGATMRAPRRNGLLHRAGPGLYIISLK